MLFMKVKLTLTFVGSGLQLMTMRVLACAGQGPHRQPRIVSHAANCFIVLLIQA
jgi:hypothetical protein